ncbi:MAG: TIGR03545 family protein [Treponema sp.]|nr:TIGR03545 family protein [Treponema sp.]
MKKESENKAKTKKSAESKSPVTAETEKKAPAEKKQKKEREPKKSEVPQKAKIPGLFKKQYSEKNLEKKIYKCIYIPADKKFLQGLVQEQKITDKKGVEKTVYSIPKDTLLTKKDAKKLKLLAKEIKKQKSRIRWAPLIAVAVSLVLLVGGVTLTKNMIIRKIIVNTCESIFEAKCDIGYVNLSFLDASFKVKKLEVANKNEPMKNLFQVDYISVDFNLLQLLRSRFVADELAVEGVETNTDRKTSGDISAKLQAKLEKKKAKQAKRAAKAAEDSAFMKLINSKKDAAISTVSNAVTDLFNEYNPETVLKNCVADLQTPEVAKNTQTEVQALTQKYKEKPAEVEAKIKEVQAIAEKAAAINFNNMTPAEIKDAIETITSAYNQTAGLKTYIEGVVSEMKTDVNSVSTMSKNLQNAINHDKNVAGDAINKYTSLSLNDGINFISSTFDSVCYSILGKYYPYVVKGVNYLANNKNNNKDKKDKVKPVKVKSTVTNRASGRNVYWKNDSAPKFWIKRIAASGSAFSAVATDITSNMDATGKPALANITLKLFNIDHKIELTVDTRSNSTAALVNAYYQCAGLPVAFSAENFNNAVGLPSISAASVMDFRFKIWENLDFTLAGTADLKNLKFEVAPFEPAYVSSIYSNTLSNIKSVYLGINGGYKEASGIDLGLKTDADKQLLAALKIEMTAQLTAIKAQAEQEIMAKLNELTGGVTADLKSFDDIKVKIDEYANYADNLSKQLEQKKKDAENQIKNAANKAVDDAKKNVTDATNKAIDDAKKNAADTLKKNASNLLKK